MTVSERIPFSGLLLPLQEGYTYSCDRRTTDGMELLFIFREDGSGELRLSGALYKFRFTLSGKTLSIDYEAEALTDCEYEVAYTDTGLELTAGKGTATQGEKFTLYRTEK